MIFRKLVLRLVVSVALALAPATAWALGFQLGQTSEELKLDFAMSVEDHGTGRASFQLTIADEGKLEPLSSVVLVIPSEDGTNHVDLSVALATEEVDGSDSASVHLTKELAQRAEIQLRTSHLDGKQEPLTWYYYSIPLSEYLDRE